MGCQQMLGFPAFLRIGSGIRAGINVCALELEIAALNTSLGDLKAGRKLLEEFSPPSHGQGRAPGAWIL